jgi:hypothetical protein
MDNGSAIRDRILASGERPGRGGGTGSLKQTLSQPTRGASTGGMMTNWKFAMDPLAGRASDEWTR